MLLHNSQAIVHCFLNNITCLLKRFKENLIMHINPFLTNVPLTDKPGSWFLLGKCWKKPADE